MGHYPQDRPASSNGRQASALAVRCLRRLADDETRCLTREKDGGLGDLVRRVNPGQAGYVSADRGTPRHVGNQVMNGLPAGIAKMTFVEPVRHKLGSVAQTVTFAPSLCRHLDFSGKSFDLLIAPEQACDQCFTAS
jgi:hypothetical protein